MNTLRPCNGFRRGIGGAVKYSPASLNASRGQAADGLKLLLPAVLILALPIILLQCSQSEKNSWLVKVENEGLSRVVLERRYKQSREFTETPVVTPGQVRKFISDTFLSDLLFLAGAHDQGLDRDPELIETVNQAREILLAGSGGALARSVIPVEFHFTDEQIQSFYHESGTEYLTAHILVNSRWLADSLYNQLQEGADFEETARKHSMDYRSRESGGETQGYFTHGMMGLDYESGITGLSVGEFSLPVHTSYGYHIIRLLDKRSRDLPPLDSLKTELIRRMEVRAQEQFLKDFFEGLFRKYEFAVNEKLIMDIVTGFRTAGLPTDFPLDQFKDLDDETFIASWNGGAMNAADYLTLVANSRGSSRILPYCADDAKEFIRNQVIFKLMVLEALDMQLDQDPSFLEQMKTRRDQKMVNLYYERNIQEAVDWTESEVRALYDNEPDRWLSRPYHTVKPAVISALQLEKTKVLTDSLVNVLYRKHPPEYNEKRLREFAEDMNLIKYKQAAAARE